MRVLLITQWKPSKGGVVTHVQNLIKHSKNTFDILTYPRYLNIPVIRALIFVLTGLLRGSRRDFELIHAHYAVPQGLLGVLLKKIKKKPLVLTIHGSDILGLGNSPVFKPLVKWVLSNSDAVIAVSRFLKERAHELGAEDEKVRVIYAGVQGSKGRGGNARGKRVVFIGSLVKQKGADILIKAFKAVEKKHMDAELVIIGDGKERRRLEKLADELKINAHFMGYSDDIGEVLRESTVLVVPSRTEGFGLVLLEAMRAGVPVVATNVGGITEIVANEQNGLLVEKEDANALAGAIIKVMEDEALRNRLISEGRKTAEKYSWSRMADEVDILYKELSERDF
jgi:N-acetyl-alpha-D-glucosaminyl L-malate synthase BshA